MGQGRERQPFTATVDPQQLGRRPALCDSTETLHEFDWQRYWPGHPEYNPFKDDRQEVMKEVRPRVLADRSHCSGVQQRNPSTAVMSCGLPTRSDRQQSAVAAMGSVLALPFSSNKTVLRWLSRCTFC